MGVVVSVVAAVTGLVDAIVGLVEGLRSDHSAGRIAPNPVMEEVERRAREAEEQQRIAEEERRRAEELQREAEERQREAEEHRRRAEEQQRRAEEDRQHAEEERQRAEEERARAEEAQRRHEEEARRAADEQRKADEARRHAEEGARRAEDERKRAEEDRHRAEEARQRADDEKKRAEEQKRQAEEEKARSEAAKRRADEEARRAKLEQEQAERDRAEADRRAAQAQAALEEAEKNLKEGIRPIIIPTSKEIAETKSRLKYKDGIFHFAIAGISGSGKSSLINALRGLRNQDCGAAATGIVETTSLITRYPDPNPANPFVWYDVPGAGTLKIPDWIYFNAQGLYAFDCIIVLFDNRFTDTDVAILRNCHRFNIPAYIVRSKSNQHIRNIMADMGYDSEDEEMSASTERELYTAARDKYTSETRASVAENLEAANLEHQRVYLVAKDALVRVVNRKPAKDMLDELVLIRDLLTEARKRRSRTARSEFLSRRS